ncbi:MAG: pyrroline-5-carboxylate reductase [Sinobacterium sp.]|nr:pyrroline-5-carboxylate reductase [Sinobacterium sp.]
MTSSPNITFIGAGNMASAIIGGLIQNGHNPEKITATAPRQSRLDEISTQFGIQTTCNNRDAIRQADILVLAVKPQKMQGVCEEIKDIVNTQQPLIISVAAGLTTAMFQQWLGNTISLVRSMPNTPSMVQTGATGLYATPQVSDEQKRQVEAMLSAIGITEWVNTENLLDAVTAVSGSGPAYFFLMMEAMIDAGEKLGLSRKTAESLCLQTALGAAKMAIASNDDVSELRRKVTSPNGTTAAALNSFEDSDLRGIVNTALTAADTRSKTLAKEMS